ncbi:MAG TPA: hypothetical protein VGC95_09490 [Chitinophagaceae bacterium]
MASVIAAPISWWVSNPWLENYPYRVQVRWWRLFGLVTISLLLVAVITISFQSIKASVANPVKSLRTESPGSCLVIPASSQLLM